MSIKAKIPNTTFGNQTATKGGILDFSAKVPKTLSKKTYVNAITMPMAKLTPIPPLLFMADTATAIKVRIKAVTGKLYFLYKTTR